MVHVSTETRNGEIRSYGESLDDGLTYDDVTELLLQLASRKSARRSKFRLRQSLFPHVAPYIVFRSPNSKGQSFPVEIARHLTWKLDPTTPPIVRKIVSKSGYRLVEGSEDWCGIWSEARLSFCYKLIENYQKINHFPGSYEIGNKDRLWKNLRQFISVYGKKQFGFVPQTFILPLDFEELRVTWHRNEKANKWIVKPPSSSRGRGIRVVNRWSQIPRKESCTIVQRYLSRPKLINDSKFDIRIYVLITCYDPLKIYIYAEGLVRFACERYDNTSQSLTNRFVHLTNYSVNRTSSRYVSNDAIDARKGHKWALNCLWDYLKEQRVNVNALQMKIHDIVVKTIVSSEASVNSFSRVYLKSSNTCYELLGMDVLIDENLKPWLLEVNVSPSLHVPSRLDAAVKGPLIKDVLNAVGYQLPPSTCPDRPRRKCAPIRHRCQDVRDFYYKDQLGSGEKRKQNEHIYGKDRPNYRDTILKDLTPADVRVLLHYEDELARVGRFQKIFPTPETHKYFRYFTTPRYNNLLLDAWERSYGRNRQAGIERLRGLCSRKYHLTHL